MSGFTFSELNLMISMLLRMPFSGFLRVSMNSLLGLHKNKQKKKEIKNINNKNQKAKSKKQKKRRKERVKQNKTSRVRIPNLMTDHVNELSLFSSVLLRVHGSTSLLHLCLHARIVPDVNISHSDYSVVIILLLYLI